MMVSCNKRLQWVDALRGVAIVLMVIYHFCYDLTYYSLADFDFYNDPFWLHSRTIILSLFLFVTGISLWLANQEQLIWTAISKRFFLILANALLISIATWQLFGDRYVYFGVLHFIAIASILGLVFLRFYWTTLIVSVVFLVMGQFESAWFDIDRWRQVVGLMTHKPATEDYVPLIPWFGVILLGIFFIQFVDKSRFRFEGQYLVLLQPLSVLGKHSLVIYMLHQPVLLGLLWVYVKFA